MILKCGLIVISFYTFVTNTCADQPWGLQETFDFNSLAYEDACEESAKAQWNFIKDPTNNDLLHTWERVQANYSSIKKLELANIKNLSDFQSDTEILTYELDVAKKPGDTLLNSTEWDKLVSFSGKATVLRSGTNHTDGTENHSRREIENFLSKNAKVQDKLSIWSNWHLRLSPLIETYSSVLQLVPDAARANNVDNVASYWELLSGYTESGYEGMKNMWEEISELHTKLVTFVQKRLVQKYNITLNNTMIPAYLLGSLDGYDWIPIAADVVPYGNVSYSIMKSLWNKNLRGKTLYKSASTMGKLVFKEVPVSDFWQKSIFNQTCSTQLINFCRDGATRVLTCHQASLRNFLTAHKVVAKVLTNQMKTESNSHSVFNTANRYSGLDEAVSEFFSILSVSPGQLHALGLIDNTTTSEQSKISSLMITALDVLPRLAYYISADLWRIDVIKNGTFAKKDLLKSWWQYRNRYERVTTDSSDIPTFLDDEFITSNKPYLPKFVGIVLGFQLYQYVTDSTEVRLDAATEYQANHDLISILKQDGADEWMKIINNKLGIYDISADVLTSFFAPLDEYLETNSDDISPLTTSQKTELSHLEELYESVDVTTTPKPITHSVPILRPKSTTSLPLPPPVVSTAKPTSKDKDAPIENKNMDFENLKPPETDENVNMNTSKAVWAVAVVLIATVTICIIAIFGRRRCVKSQAPKNRRYV